MRFFSVTGLPIRLRPTWPGFFWLMVAMALLAIAINGGHNFVFALAFVLFALWFVTGWACRRSLVGLLWLPEVGMAAFAGEKLNVAGSLRAQPGASHDPVCLAVSGGRERKTRIPSGRAVMPSDGAMLEISLPAMSRGEQTVQALSLLSLHPLGLWQARRALPPVSVLVFPRPAGKSLLPAEMPSSARERREADDFSALRAYAPGDTRRRINWRIYGRTRALMVNDFDGGVGGRALWLSWDACQGDQESRLSQLALWVIEADRRGWTYGLSLSDGKKINPGQGKLHRLACLRSLACHECFPVHPVMEKSA
jgi:uncharacterized protein (DUF58 family)